MSSATNSPGTMADDDTVGTVAWSDPDNAKVSDGVFATTYFGGGSQGNAAENIIKIIKGGVISGTDKSSSTSLPATLAYVPYGSSSDLWGLSWTPADINASDFGVAFSVLAENTGTTTHYLDATNFGFSIPVGVTINGIVVEIQDYTALKYTYVDHIRITVYYTIIGPFPTFFQIGGGGAPSR